MYQPVNVETQLRSQEKLAQPPPGVEGLITRDQQQFLNQAMSDKQLLDRIMPLIINRLDGKMLAQKILPHLKVTLRMGDNYGPLVEVKKEGLPPDSYHTAEAYCPPGTRVMGGGGTISPNAVKEGDSSIVMMGPIPTQRFQLTAKMGNWDGDVMAYATCVGGEAIVGLKP